VVVELMLKVEQQEQVAQVVVEQEVIQVLVELQEQLTQVVEVAE
jgi:hypothetical protein